MGWWVSSRYGRSRRCTLGQGYIGMTPSSSNTLGMIPTSNRIHWKERDPRVEGGPTAGIREYSRVFLVGVDTSREFLGVFPR